MLWAPLCLVKFSYGFDSLHLTNSIRTSYISLSLADTFKFWNRICLGYLQREMLFSQVCWSNILEYATPMSRHEIIDNTLDGLSPLLYFIFCFALLPGVCLRVISTFFWLTTLDWVSPLWPEGFVLNRQPWIQDWEVTLSQIQISPEYKHIKFW
jgi:hypothetical protein